MPFTLTFYAPDEKAANMAAQEAFARIEQLNRIMSDYDPESELMRLCRPAGQGRAVQISDDLFFVLSRSLELSKRSDGAFDVTVGPLVRLWRRARRQKELPAADRLAADREAVGYQLVRLDPRAQTAELLKPGMRLDLGGIAVGYAVDEAMTVLRKHGITRAMVDASGDIAVSEPPPGAAGWRIAIQLPRVESRQVESRESQVESQKERVEIRESRGERRKAPPERKDNRGKPADLPTRRLADSPTRQSAILPERKPGALFLLLRNAAVTTSGDAFQYVEICGVRYSHIVDPRTGLGLTDRSQVTLIAPDCITADSLATAVSVLGPHRGLKLIEDAFGAAAWIIRAPEGRIETYQSGKFDQFLAPDTDQ